jgi:hypothetical protein
LPTKKEKSKSITDKILIGMEPILRIIEAAIYSAFVEDAQKCSICLIAPPEAGKTQAMMYFENFPTVQVYADLTAKPLDSMIPAIQKGELRHIIITDIVAINAHNQRTSALFYSRMSALMEEGMRNSGDAGGIIKWIDAEGKAPTCGMIAGMTPGLMTDKRSFWRKTGFVSRFIPICFNHHMETQSRIRETMLRYSPPTIPTHKAIPKKQIEVKMQDSHKKEILNVGQAYSVQTHTYGYRYISHMSGLMRGHALANGRRETNDQDLEFIWDIHKFSNPDNPFSI